MFAETKMTDDLLEIEAFLLRERDKALSEAEWKFRMRGYGYDLRRTQAGVEVCRLPQQVHLGTLAM